MARLTSKRFVKILLAATEQKQLQWYYDNRTDHETESYFATGVGNSEIKLTIKRDADDGNEITMTISKDFSSIADIFTENDDKFTEYDDLIKIIDEHTKTTKYSEFLSVIPKSKSKNGYSIDCDDEDEEESEDDED